MSVLTLQHLSKKYGRIQALQDVSFEVPEGCVFGILGPNGSGKTTLLGIIMNVLQPSGGDFSFFKEPASAALRKKIGTLLETPNFYAYLSAVDNLKIAASIKGVPESDIDRVLELVALTERKDSKFSTYSLGMKQRLAIASCLLGDPTVLVFDEPTNGLDPVGIAEIRNLIIQLYKQGKTIIMASHLLDEVEKVCTHVAILQRGKLLASGNVDEILVNEDIVEVASTNLDALAELLKDYPELVRMVPQSQFLELYFTTGMVSMESLNQFCFSKGIVLQHLRLRKKSLETKFFELTQNK